VVGKSIPRRLQHGHKSPPSTAKKMMKRVIDNSVGYIIQDRSNQDTLPIIATVVSQWLLKLIGVEKWPKKSTMIGGAFLALWP